MHGGLGMQSRLEKKVEAQSLTSPFRPILVIARGSFEMHVKGGGGRKEKRNLKIPTYPTLLPFAKPFARNFLSSSLFFSPHIKGVFLETPPPFLGGRALRRNPIPPSSSSATSSCLAVYFKAVPPPSRLITYCCASFFPQPMHPPPPPPPPPPSSIHIPKHLSTHKRQRRHSSLPPKASVTQRDP